LLCFVVTSVAAAPALDALELVAPVVYGPLPALGVLEAVDATALPELADEVPLGDDVELLPQAATNMQPTISKAIPRIFLTRPPAVC
jgi:hypothetical protein